MHVAWEAQRPVPIFSLLILVLVRSAIPNTAGHFFLTAVSSHGLRDPVSGPLHTAGQVVPNTLGPGRGTSEG